MEISNGRTEIYARQMYMALLQADLSNDKTSEPINLREQTTIDRRNFDMFTIKMTATCLKAAETFYEPQLSQHVVQELLDREIPKLHSQFHWLKQADTSHMTDLLSGISTFRSQFVQKHGTLPSDGRIYREYRSILETAEPEDKQAYLNVVILEAMMNGDIIHGTLPPFSIE